MLPNQKATSSCRTLKIQSVKHISRLQTGHKLWKKLHLISLHRRLKLAKIQCSKHLVSKHRILRVKLILKSLLLRKQTMPKSQSSSRESIRKYLQSLQILKAKLTNLHRIHSRRFLHSQKMSTAKSVISSRTRIKKFLQLRQTSRTPFPKSMRGSKSGQRLSTSSLLRAMQKFVKCLEMRFLRQRLRQRNLRPKRAETAKHWNLCGQILASRFRLFRNDTPNFIKRRLQMPTKRNPLRTKNTSRFQTSILICSSLVLKKKSTECRVKSTSA